MPTLQTTEPKPPAKSTPATNGFFKLDDATIATQTAHYPEEAKAAVLWIAGFLRERCSGRRDVLVDMLRGHGFKTTDNYWYRILSGRYFEQGEDGKLVGSVANLVQCVDQLRSGVVLQQRSGRMPFVETGTYQRISNYISLKRAPEGVCKFGVIIGPTGGQKTECAKHYCFLNNHGTCVHLEAPFRGSFGEFIQDLGARYGIAKSRSSYMRIDDITRNVNDKKTIIVDNVQRLYKRGAGGDQPIFNFLQKLQDDTRCTVILMFAELGAEFLTEGLEQGFFEQFEGRAGGRKGFLVLDDWTPREDIKQIAQACGIADAESEAVIKYLEQLSRQPGRVRILFDAIQQGKRLAEVRKQPFTVAHIKEAREVAK